MPNKLSSKKRARQNEKRREHNRSKRSAMRTAIKKVHHAAEHGELEGIDQKLRFAQSKVAKGAKSPILKKETANRIIARMNKAVKDAKEKAEASA